MIYIQLNVSVLFGFTRAFFMASPRLSHTWSEHPHKKVGNQMLM